MTHTFYSPEACNFKGRKRQTERAGEEINRGEVVMTTWWCSMSCQAVLEPSPAKTVVSVTSASPWTSSAQPAEVLPHTPRGRTYRLCQWYRPLWPLQGDFLTRHTHATRLATSTPFIFTYFILQVWICESSFVCQKDHDVKFLVSQSQWKTDIIWNAFFFFFLRINQISVRRKAHLKLMSI